MAKDRRPFNPNVLAELKKKGSIKGIIGVGAVVWKYTVLVPTEETKKGENPKSIATDDDLENLEELLTKDFDGLTILPHSMGHGLRGGEIELNRHMPFVVYALPVTPSELYFQALRKELEDALQQEAILVERHEVWLQ